MQIRKLLASPHVSPGFRDHSQGFRYPGLELVTCGEYTISGSGFGDSGMRL